MCPSLVVSSARGHVLQKSSRSVVFVLVAAKGRWWCRRVLQTLGVHPLLVGSCLSAMRSPQTFRGDQDVMLGTGCARIDGGSTFPQVDVPAKRLSLSVRLVVNNDP